MTCANDMFSWCVSIHFISFPINSCNAISYLFIHSILMSSVSNTIQYIQQFLRVLVWSYLYSIRTWYIHMFVSRTLCNVHLFVWYRCLFVLVHWHTLIRHWCWKVVKFTDLDSETFLVTLIHYWCTMNRMLHQPRYNTPSTVGEGPKFSPQSRTWQGFNTFILRALCSWW